MQNGPISFMPVTLHGVCMGFSSQNDVVLLGKRAGRCLGNGGDLGRLGFLLDLQGKQLEADE